MAKKLINILMRAKFIGLLKEGSMMTSPVVSLYDTRWKARPESYIERVRTKTLSSKAI